MPSYAPGPDLVPRVLDALAAATGREEGYTPDDLRPVDGFHIRGRLGTRILAEKTRFEGNCTVLDLGSGPGGTARHLAQEHGCRVTGLDITPEYVDLAAALSRLTGLSDRTSFVVGDVTTIPFEAETFDCVWCEHVQVNVADKTRLAREIHRVLKPGGRLIQHEVFAGRGGDPLYPAPWGDAAGDGHLVDARDWLRVLDTGGFLLEFEEDVTADSAAWVGRMLGKRETSPGPAFGLPLIMGARGEEKLRNLGRNLLEERITVTMLAARRR